MKQQKYILTGYRAKGINLYTPKRNKIKVGVLLAVVVGCLITPFTNWVLIPMGKILNKYPIWIYK